MTFSIVACLIGGWAISAAWVSGMQIWQISMQVSVCNCMHSICITTFIALVIIPSAQLLELAVALSSLSSLYVLLMLFVKPQSPQNPPVMKCIWLLLD